MKLLPGYLLYLAEGSKRFRDLIRTLSKCGRSGEVIFIMRPSVVSVWLDRGRIRRLVIPPSSIALSPEVLESCGTGQADYLVAEEAWVDGKPIPEVSSISKGKSRCLLVDSLEEVFGNLGNSGKCYISCGGKVGDLIRNLLNPLVFDLSTLDDVDKVEVEGFISTLWPHHPVLYGLAFADKVSLTIANVSRTVLRYYVKPLAYLNNYAFLYEVPYSNSILFAGYGRELLEVAIRAVLYSC